MKFLPLSLTIWAEGTKGPENMGDSSCRRVSMEDRRPMDSNMILPSKAGRISNEKLPDIPWGAGSWSPLKIGAWIAGWQEVFCAGNLKRKRSPLQADISYGRNPLLDGLYLAGRSPSFQDGSTIPASRLWLWDIWDPDQMMKTEDFFDFRRAWMNCHLLKLRTRKTSRMPW